ncbi:MAG TPA: carbon monoxide dehydrogenase [Alphaproteobacteria bacterium]|nr:carbon monoxide dehydrogenase [Alphaproteobacteria bacterium]
MGQFAVGQPLRRKEDDRFITGQGRYGDDVNLPGQSYACFVRAPYAHADILSIDSEEARAAPGVIAVLTGEDLAAAGLGGMPCIARLPGRDGKSAILPHRAALPQSRVRHTGEPVAIVIAESAAQARDGAELVAVDYAELPLVADTAQAMAEGAAQIWPEAPRNLCLDWETGDARATDTAFANADHVCRLRLVNNRLIANPMEPRMAIGEYDPATERYTVHTATQGVFRWRGLVAEPIFHLPPERMRVRTYDVGGSFGMKAFVYPEQIACAWAAKQVARPVKWTGERAECFLTDNQGRDHLTDAEMALDKSGKILAVRCHITANIGAYASVMGPGVPTVAAGGLQVGVYAVPALYVNVQAVFTNTAPVDAYRGAGRPEAAYVIERLIDHAARELEIAPDALRARNFIPPEAMPYQSAGGFTYDSGNFNLVMEKAKQLADWDGFTDRRKARHATGKLSGIGMAYYVEKAGGPPQETARITAQPDGTTLVYMGNQSNGMGHETVYAQVAADALGIPFDTITVTSGDSDILSDGGLSGGSGSGLMGSGAVDLAGLALLEKARSYAADMMEAATQDIDYRDGVFTVTGTDRQITLWEVARHADPRHGLSGDGQYQNTPNQFPNGCHICEVEIDPETGTITILRHTIVDDFGTVLNPMIVAGQVHGGTAQGLGQALGEQAVYDPESGQLVTGSFMDYWIPRAADLPDFTVATEDIPCTTNAFGVKGCGEAGATGAPPALVNAVLDAVAERGITHLDMPLTPFYMWRILNDAANNRSAAM